MINNFSSDDYNSNDGFSGEIWGSCMWFLLHIISFNYPCKPLKKHKMYYYSFFKILPKILPCGICRDHLEETYKKKPLSINIFKNRKTLSKYVYQLHDEVNKQLNKTKSMSYKDVSNFYENLRSRCLISSKNSNKLDCDTPSYKGIKSKCIIKIVPRDKICDTLSIDNKCILEKII